MTDRNRQSSNERNLFLNRYFNLILSFLVILLFIFSYLLLLGPKYNSAQLMIKENLINQQLLYNQQRKKLDTLKVIADIYSKIPASDLNKLNSVLPYEYKQEQLFGEFEEIAEKNGWILESVSLSYPDEIVEGRVVSSLENEAFFGSLNQNIGQVEVGIVLTGLDYLGVRKLLTALETNLRLLDVKELSFSGDSQVEITLVTYYYRILN